MAVAHLTIDLAAVRANWRTLAAQSTAETGAVVKADAYGLGAAQIATTLAKEGARKFFVALAEEGATLRTALGPGPEIFVFSGHMPGDAPIISAADLTPLLNSVDQMLVHVESLPHRGFGIQLDSGMNRLGMEPAEWSALRSLALAQAPAMIMSHLACADEPDHPMNRQQLECFLKMTEGVTAPRSLSATGGILMGSDYHFDITRPGVGLYGGLPFSDALPVVQIDLPIIQVRDLLEGETVGYGNSWRSIRPSRIATVNAGYADGILRAAGGQMQLLVGTIPCPAVGRISMDMIGVDITDLEDTPDSLQILGPTQDVDSLANAAGTIGYEVLTSLGSRYNRRYIGA
jgi:alanine racemase